MWADHAVEEGLGAPHTDAAGGEHVVARTTATAVRELYNPAQLDVLARLQDLVAREPS